MITANRKPGLIPTDKELAMRSAIENVPTARELFNFVCGDFLGAGISRMVFDYKPDKRYVIKIELGDMNANVIEHNIWKDVQHSDMALWFAPCGELSHNGKILLQRKCKKPKSLDEYPARVPIFFTDLKYANWGTLGGRFVCMDYAGALLNQYGLAKRMRKADWWDKTSL